MRPSEDVLSRFEDLADHDENKRYTAIVNIIQACKSEGKYCIERLIVGLASPRAAARLGFSTALTHALSVYSEQWSAKQLFNIADNKLDATNMEGTGGVLGGHLLYTAMINSKSYTEAVDELVERELCIMDKHKCYSMAVVQSLAELAKQLDRQTFDSKVWAKLKHKVCLSLDSISSPWIYFALLIRDTFKETMKGKVTYLAQSKLTVDESNYGDVVNLLKRTEGCSEGVLARELLLAAREGGCFPQVYTNVVNKWLLSGDLHKVFERCFEFVDELLSMESWKPNELVVIFSSSLVATLRSVKKGREYRFYEHTINSVLDKLNKALSSCEWKRTELLSMLESVDGTAGGNLDEYLHCKFRISESILAKLDLKGLDSVINKALISGGWALRRISNVFSNWSDDQKEAVLVKLLKRDPRNDEVHATLCKCIDSLFVVNVRAGRGVKVAFKQEHEVIIVKAVQANNNNIKSLGSSNRALNVMWYVLNMWAMSTPQPIDRTHYLKAVTEIESISKMLTEHNTEQPLSVLMDLLLSLLSGTNRHHRTLVHFVFASMLPLMSTANILHILETISLPDEEMMKSDDDDEDEAMTIDHNHVDNELESEENEDTEDSDNDNDMNEDEVNEEFKNKLETALGQAAALSSDDDDSKSVDSTVSDETMFGLDAGLAMVFKEQMKGRKANKTSLEQMHQFRLKCFDLLLILLSHQHANKFTSDLIVPLLQLARESLSKSNAEVSFSKASSLLEIIVKHRKTDVSEKKAIKVLEKMVAASSQIVNPVLRTLVGTISSFLVSTAYNQEEQSICVKMRSQVESVFIAYMTQTDNQVLSELATAPLFKYPWVFTSFLPRLIDLAFDESLRIYRRTEALACAVVFMRKDLANKWEEHKDIWSCVSDKLAAHLHQYLTALNADDAKPRFLALALKLLTAFAGLANTENKKHLHEVLHGDLSALCENEELWKAGGRMKRFNSASQNICGRSCMAVLKQAQVLISTL